MRKEEKESGKKKAASKEKRLCVSGRYAEEFQLLARCSLDRAGINLLGFA